MNITIPKPGDFAEYRALRLASADYLQASEPTWRDDELSADRFRQRLKSQQAERDRGLGYAFFLRNDGGQLVGGMTIGPVRRGPLQSASVGTWIGKPFVGRGHAIRATAWGLRFAFKVLSLRRIEASVLVDNYTSIRGLEFLGFKKEGLARDFMSINGVWKDHLLYAITLSDWRSLHHGGDAAGGEQQTDRISRQRRA
jgi:ribosomal-protein-alanine N-acetyltransferase